MKKFQTIGLLLLMLIGVSLSASAYKLTLEWNDPEAVTVKIGGLTSADEPLSAGQTSYIFEETAGKYVYVIAKPGYKITEISTPAGAVNPGFNASYGQFFSKYCTETTISAWGENPVVKVTTEKINRNQTFTVNVENGAAYISAQLTNFAYSFDLANGENKVNFDSSIDKTLSLAGKNGVTEFFSVTHNGNPVTKAYMWSTSYDIPTIQEGDVVNIRVFEDEEPAVEDVTLSLDFAEGLEGCLNNIRDWTASSFIFPDDIVDGKITLTSGSDIQFNFKEDFTFTSFSLNGTDLTSSYNSSNRSLRFKVTEDCTLRVEGSATAYNDVVFTAYVSHPEGVILYQGKYQENPADLSAGSTITEPITLDATLNSDGAVATDAVTMTAADTRMFQLPVSEKTPYIFVAPKEGWYIYTVQGKEDGTMTEIDNANLDAGSTTFYVVARKLDNAAKMKVNVTGDARLRLSASTAKSQRWDNPSPSYTLAQGENTIEFEPGYHTPFTLRSLESITNFQVWFDGIGVTPDDNGAFSFTPYTGADKQSVVTVFADGKTVGRAVSVQIACEDGMEAEASLGAIGHPIATDNTIAKALENTEVYIKPSSKSAYITLKTTSGTTLLHGYGDDGSYVNGLNEAGECSFVASSTRNIVTVGCRNYTTISVDPASGSTLKSLASIKVTIPVDSYEQMFYSSDEAIAGITLVKEGSDPIHGAYIGEPSMDYEGTSFIYPVYFSGEATEAGEYTLTIPAGTFYEVLWDDAAGDFVQSASGAKSAELTAVYTIDPSMKSKIDNYILKPAAGSALSSLNVVYLEYPDYDPYTMVQIRDELGASFSNGSKSYSCMIGYDWENYKARGCMVIPCDDDYNEVVLTEEGTWTLTLPAGTFFYDGEESQEITATFNIGADFPAYPITPAPGQVTTNLSEFTISFIGAYEAEYSDLAITLTGENFEASSTYVSEAGDMAFAIQFGSAPFEAGEYTLTIPAGAFTVNGEPSQEVKATYTYEPCWKLTPAPNTTVESLDELLLEFPYATEVEFIGNQLSFVLTNNSNYASTGYECVPVAGAPHPTFRLTVDAESESAPLGNLVFIVNEGTFLIDGAESPMIRAPFTLDHEISAAYTATPTGGQIVYGEWGYYWSFIFDEAASVQADRDLASKIKVTLDDETLTYDTDYIVMPEGNNLLMGVINPDFYKEGTLHVSIPAGAFTLSGTPSPAIEHEWEIVAPRDYIFVVTPDGTETVSDLSAISIAFPEASTIEVYNRYGCSLTQSYEYRQTPEITSDEYASVPTAILSFDSAPEAKGEYTLTINVGAFTLDGCQESPGIRVTYTFDPTTGVEVVSAEANVLYTVVTIDGRVVLHDATASEVKELAPGFYIINGKKVLIK